MSNPPEAGFTPQIEIADLVGIPPQEWVFLPPEVVNDPDWHRLNEEYWEELRASQEAALKEAGRPDQLHPRLFNMFIIQLRSVRCFKHRPPETRVTTWLVEEDRRCFWHTLTSPDDADPIVAKLASEFPGYRMRTKIFERITTYRLLIEMWLNKKDKRCFWHTIKDSSDADEIAAKLTTRYPGYQMRTRIFESKTPQRLLVQARRLLYLYPLTESLDPIPSHRDQLGPDRLAHEIFDGYVDPDSITAELLISTLVQQGRFRVYPRSFR